MADFVGGIFWQVLRSLFFRSFEAQKMQNQINHTIRGSPARREKQQNDASREAKIAARTATRVSISNSSKGINGCLCNDETLHLRTRDAETSSADAHSEQAQQIESLERKIRVLSDNIGNLNRNLCDQTNANTNLEERLAWKESELCNSHKDCEVWQRICNAENRKLKQQKLHWQRAAEQATIDKVATFDKFNEIKKTCDDLEKSLEEVKLKREIRETEMKKFVKDAKLCRKRAEADHDALTAQCNRLVKQVGSRRAFVPTEDESKVVDAFRKLHVEIRCWCLAAFDLLTEGSEMRFTRFPLASEDVLLKFSTDEVSYLIACIWEWLMRSVFGLDETTNHPDTDKVFDLWTNESSARQLQALEHQIGKSQKLGVLHEWRSFTVQCLYTDGCPPFERIDTVVTNIKDWLLPVLDIADGNSEAIANLMEDFKTEVVIPAISFSGLLRKRYTPILINTPLCLQDSLENWRKKEWDHNQAESDLEIIVMPELRKIDLEASSQDAVRYVVLLEAERYRIIDESDEIVAVSCSLHSPQSAGSQQEDTEMSM